MCFTVALSESIPYLGHIVFLYIQSTLFEVHKSTLVINGGRSVQEF